MCIRDSIKSKGSEEFASPFDEEIDFNQEVTFSYESQNDGYIVNIGTKNERMENNLNHMKIREAYGIHAVSYTHLDVYKRQRRGRYKGAFL